MRPLMYATLAAAGLIVGAVTVAALGASGLMPMRFGTENAVLAGLTVPWFVPVIGLARSRETPMMPRV